MRFTWSTLRFKVVNIMQSAEKIQNCDGKTTSFFICHLKYEVIIYQVFYIGLSSGQSFWLEIDLNKSSNF